MNYAGKKNLTCWTEYLGGSNKMTVTISGVTFAFGSRLQKDADKSIQYLLIRLLIGLASVTYRGTKVVQKCNYGVLPPTPQATLGKTAISQFFTNYNLGISEKEFIRASMARNRKFFRDILIEYSHFLLNTHRKQHIAAFAMLYRLLERMSFSTPLLYCKASHDFFATFDSLKSLFNDQSKAGELGFLKQFLNQGQFIDATLLDSTYTIDFSTYPDRSKYFAELTRIFDKHETKDPLTHQITVKFRNISSLTTEVRNRFFHMRTGDGQYNFRVADLGDPDDFFAEINKCISSFVALVALQTAVTT